MSVSWAGTPCARAFQSPLRRRRAGRTRKWPNPGVDEELGRCAAPRLSRWPGPADSYRDFKPELQLQVRITGPARGDTQIRADDHFTVTGTGIASLSCNVEVYRQ